MKKKRIVRMIVDISMVALLPLLMAYILVGQKMHEILGIIMLIIMILHHLLNLRWYKSLLKGKYTVGRVVNTVLDMLLLVTMFATMMSGIAMSKHVFAFLDLPIAASTARKLHMLMSNWSMILMSVHLGFHWNMIEKMISKALHMEEKSMIRSWFLRMITVAIAGYGVWAFVKRGVADYLFQKAMFVFFDYQEPFVLFLLDYMAIMGLFIVTGYYITKVLSFVGKWKNKRSL